MRNPLNIFTKKPSPPLEISQFKVGDIYQMAVASRSHVKKPYYVIIKDVGTDYIETNIPKCHSLKIKLDSFEWKYHIPRMRFVGRKEESGSLLYNQSGLVG